MFPTIPRSSGAFAEFLLSNERILCLVTIGGIYFYTHRMMGRCSEFLRRFYGQSEHDNRPGCIKTGSGIEDQVKGGYTEINMSCRSLKRI